MVIASSLGVLLFSLYINYLSKNTKNHVELVGDRAWPTLDKTKQLQFHFEHLVEQMHQAVVSRESESLFEAESELIAIREIIKQLGNVQPHNKERGDQLMVLVNEYFQQTRRVSQALIANAKNASETLAHDQENIKNNAIMISDALHSWNLEAENTLLNLLQQSKQSADATSNTSILGCLFIIILGLLSYWTYRSNLILPIQRLTQRAQDICKGQLDKINVEEFAQSNNEFSQMALALSNLLVSLQKNNQAFKEQNDKLIASTKAKSAFLANMSHEIRTPLASIIGFSEELLEDQSMPLEQRQAALSTIIQGGNHLRNIINDILDISKIEADKLQIKASPIKLIDLISEIRDLISMQSMKKGLDFSVEIKNSIPEIIDADALRLKQILLNLCSNACKFSDFGRVILTVEYSELTNVLTFSVNDNGIGISADELPHVFDEFYQADSSASRKYGGTGLGLPISKKLANMMDGDITAESVLGKGSKFVLSINAGNSALGTKIKDIKLNEPLRKQVEHTAPEQYAVFNGNASDRVKILLAEDTPDNQRLISMFLKRYNIDLVIVDNGKKALQEASKNDYDLLLMDIQMPYMNGIEATELLIKSGYKKPIIAVTANAMQDDIGLYMNVGFSHVVAKPIVKKLLIDAIETHVDKKLSCIDSTKASATAESKPLPVTNPEPEIATAVQSETIRQVADNDVTLIRNVIEQLRQLENHLSTATSSQSTKPDTSERLNNESQNDVESREPVVSTLFEDDPELLSILSKYIEDLKNAEKEIRSAYETKDWESLKSQMHKVKGTGGAFGYPALSTIAKEIHQQVLHANVQEIDALMPEFFNYCQRIFLGYKDEPSAQGGQQAAH